jgi:hypothetical protein
MKFEKEQDALKYLVSARENQCFLRYLGGQDIAKLLHLRGGVPDSSLSGHFANGIESIGKLSSDLTKMLETSKLVDTEKLKRIEKYSGLLASSESNKGALPSLPELLSSLTNPPSQPSKSSQSSQSIKTPNPRCLYLPSSDSLLISQNDQLKLIARPSTSSPQSFFDSPPATFFKNHLKSIYDDVWLSVSHAEVKCMVELVEWTEFEKNAVLREFCEKVQESFNGSSIRAPFFDALLSIKQLTVATLQTLKRIEESARTTEAQ